MILFLLWAAFTTLYFHIGKTIPINSDGVANILEAQSILKGNIILHGWTLPSDTFYSLDTQVDALLLWLGIHGFVVYHLTPAIAYSSLLTLIYYIIKDISNSTLKALTSISIFLAFPTSLYKSLVLFSPIHIITIFFVISAFYFYHKTENKNRFIYGFILLYIAIIGDPYAIFIGTIPIILYTSVMVFRTLKNSNIKIEFNFLWMLLSAIIATLLAKLTVYIISIIGGYSVIKNNLSFIPLDKFGHNFYLLVLSMLEVNQSNFFGSSLISFRTFIEIIHALLLIMAIYLILKNRIGKCIIVDLCIISITVTCLAFVFSTEPINIETSRYLLDVPFFIAIIFPVLIPENRYIIFLILSSVVFFIFFKTHTLEDKPASNKEYYRVIKFIKRMNVNYGIAGYWNAAPFTLLSDNAIEVRQVIKNDSGSIVPFMWLSSSSWYRNINHPQFVILGTSGNFGLTEDAVKKNFGPYKQLKIIGPYKVIIY